MRRWVDQVRLVLRTSLLWISGTSSKLQER